MANETASRGRDSATAEISTAMVKFYKETFGRGPTKVRTSYAGPDTLIVILEDSFTPAERQMAAMGEHQRLRDVRMFLKHATENQMRTLIERITGRRIRYFMSGVDTKVDASCEVFGLVPLGDSP